MAVANWLQYSITKHAKQRVLERFNITDKELGPWLNRLLQECTYVGPAKKAGCQKYRLNGIVLVADSAAKQVVTVYTKNADDDNPVSASLNPEVQSFLNEQFTQYAKRKRTATALKIQADLETALAANQKMLSKHTSTRYISQGWTALMNSLMNIQKETQSANELIKQAHDNMNQKE